jgi:hypothetical protein
MTIKKKLLILLAYFFISLGIFYSASKYHIPWYGSDDFANYSLMTTKPFDNDVQAAFAYRFITPTAAHYIYKFELFYTPEKTPFKDNYSIQNGVFYDPSSLAALIFTNYLFLTLAAFFTYITIAKKIKKNDLTSNVLALGLPVLIYLSFSTIVHGYNGLTEGGSLFFISLLTYLFYEKKLVIFGIIVLLSVWQREVIPIIMFIYILFAPIKTKKSIYLIISFIAFMSYVIIRKKFWPLPGSDDQLILSAFYNHFFSLGFSKEFFLQGILSNNLIFFIFFSYIILGIKNIKFLFPYIMVILLMIPICVGIGASNGIARILNIASPLLIFCLSELLIKKNKDKNV